MKSVLDGIRVLDLSWGVAGPITGMLLSDNGADVVKVEPPGGDPFRSSPGYAAWLRGRRSAELDLTGATDRHTFLDLARSADIVLESFAPGTTAQLGIDADTLFAQNPSLIYCSITGYGPHPGLRARPGYDALVAARLGLLHEQRGHLGGAIPHMHGEDPYLPDLPIPEGMEPGSPRPGPIFTYTPWPSICAAYLATTGINAALLARLRTGRGQHVETSLLQAALSLTASKWVRAEHNDEPHYRTWIYDQRAPKGFFQCADGRWVEQWVPNPRFVMSSAAGETLAHRRDVDSVRDDPDRIGTAPENIVVLAHYFPEMVDAFARFDSDDWVRVAEEAGVPLQPVRTPEEALTDPALVAESAVVEVDHPDHGPLHQVGILYGLSRTPGRVQGPVPRVGEHTAQIRTEARRAQPTPDARPPRDGSHAAPLDGVTVLDLGFAVAGPFGTQVLADLGADVIKVNATRDPWWHANHIAYGANRGKRSICIDLKTPEGLSVLHRLVERADVVHSNMRRDALRRLQCDEVSLRAVNSDIIYCHTRGFDRGPRSDSPGNDQTGCSLAGVTYEDGGTHDGGKPFWSLTSLGDTGNGFLSAIGVIQALYHRARSGEAQSVDTSILNAGLLAASMTSVRADGTSVPRPRVDRMQLGLHPLYRLYQTTDGWVCIAATKDEHWRGLLDALGQPGVGDDPRFGDAPGRAAHRQELDELLEPLFRRRTAAEVFAALDEHGVPCEIADPEFSRRAFDDPEMRELGLLVEQQHPKLGRFEHFGTTISFSDTPGRIWGPPPVVGQHTREIMREYDFGDDEIEKLLAGEAVFEDLWVD
ncbi:MAG TPA: CoA transferase [Acidimicrobiales bacterium]|jgi:crotonobetainyl-CoA:carnitine CoA-transferase CaiB-like acyl-CoA transferase|nr:CoA transferase [Acidimicrobiales bacterium]